MAESPCILCGRCLGACPLFRLTGREELSPRAKGLMDMVAGQDKSLSEKELARLAGLCLSCGRCERVCTQDVGVPALVARMRARTPGFSRWVWKKWLKSPDLWARAASLDKVAAKLPGHLGRAASEGLRGLGADKLEPFIKPGPGAVDNNAPVMLFSGCLGSGAWSHLRDTALGLLAARGFQTHAPKAPCCGLPLASAGCRDERQESAHGVIDIWRELGRPPVATFCASCRHGLSGYEADLFEDGGEHEKWLAAQAPLSTLIDGPWIVEGSAYPSLSYHTPCHEEPHGPDRVFLRRILGEDLSKTGTEHCCGFGGVLRLGDPDLADLAGRDMWQALHPGHGGAVITGCSGCALRLKTDCPHGVFAGHWLEIFSS